MPHQARQTSNAHRGLIAGVASVVAVMLFTATAMAAEGSAAADARSRHDRERAACLDGRSQQDRATCLKEAGAALDESRSGRLGAGPAATEANATARCKALPEKDRSDCVARIHGAGTSSGSVRDGGIYRELVTRTPAPPAAQSDSPRQARD